jgi:hypothetical protein
MLTAWAAGQDAVGSRRGQVVRAAIDPGLRKSEVHRLTGMARTTIDRIAGTTRGPGTGPAMTAISAVCVASARPYALGIPGRAWHDARLCGTADRRFRTIAVIPGPVPAREEKHC